LRSFSKALVTGGAGFIGSHLVDRLLAEGFEVTVLDDFSAGQMQNIAPHRDLEEFHLVHGDVRDTCLVKKVVGDIDVVFHEAALVDVHLSIENPLLFNDVNLAGTLNLLKACSDSDVKRFIFASSAAVYGDSKPDRKRETTLCKPVSPYAVSKLAAEKYAEIFNDLYGLETVSLRYFNVYGPRQLAESSYSAVITAFISRLLSVQSPIIFGDGMQTRDFVHVDDVVSANMLALWSKNVVGEVFVIGSGTTTSVYELAQRLQAITNTEHLKPIFAEPRAGDIKHCSADISKAQKLLCFHPKIRLEDGLLSLVKWHLNRVSDVKQYLR
jgi:nucleoside-diphosphate-sugar epimerase